MQRFTCKIAKEDRSQIGPPGHPRRADQELDINNTRKTMNIYNKTKSAYAAIYYIKGQGNVQVLVMRST